MQTATYLQFFEIGNVLLVLGKLEMWQLYKKDCKWKSEYILKSRLPCTNIKLALTVKNVTTKSFLPAAI
jgi:hypothetical protein